MEATKLKGEPKLERKIISISTKRQLTIPQKYFELLGFQNEAECILQNGGMLIRPVRNVNDGEFAEQILADLIQEGYMGQELLSHFKKRSREIRPAVEKLLEETDFFIKNGGGQISIEELFGSED